MVDIVFAHVMKLKVDIRSMTSVAFMSHKLKRPKWCSDLGNKTQI